MSKNLKYKIQINNNESILEISQKPFSLETTVIVDSIQLGKFTQKQLKPGVELKLSDGSTLKLVLKTTLYPELHIFHNNEPLKGTISDPEVRIKTGWKLIFFLAGLNMIMFIIAFFFKNLQKLGYGYYNLIIGLIYLPLGFYAKKRSILAFAITILIFLFDTAMAIRQFYYLTPTAPPVGPMFIRIMFIFYLSRSLITLKKVKSQINENI